MLYDLFDRHDLAERIAAAEGRIAKLQERVTRLIQEGSDASREQETLHALNSNLRQLYDRQAKMRNSSWRLAS